MFQWPQYPDQPPLRPVHAAKLNSTFEVVITSTPGGTHRRLSLQSRLQAGLSHPGMAVQTPGTVISGHSETDHAIDRFHDKTRYSPLVGTEP